MLDKLPSWVKKLGGPVLYGLITVIALTFQAGQASNAKDEWAKKIEAKTEQNSVDIQQTNSELKDVRDDLTKHKIDQARFEGKVDEILEILKREQKGSK